MNNLFANLRINRIIIHQIFVRNENKEVVEPRYNNALTNLDLTGLSVLQDRIINALGNNSHSIEMEVTDVSPNSTFEHATKAIVSNNEGFIETSKNIALKLATAQTSRKIPGGVVVVFDGTIGATSRRFVGIIKAEIHEGFSIDNDENLVLKFVANLLLTPQQKLYKIGVFIEMAQPSSSDVIRAANEFKAFIYDHNMNSAETNQAAVYFYNNFLGCSISPSNKKLTRDFYSNTKEFIEAMDIPNENKVDLNSALYTYLKVTQRNVIQVSEFAEEFLQLEFRDAYCNYMEVHGIPSHAIPKDIELIKSKLQRRNLKFTSNVKIIAPSENFTDLVEILGFEDTKTTLRIEGRIQEQ